MLQATFVVVQINNEFCLLFVYFYFLESYINWLVFDDQVARDCSLCRLLEVLLKERFLVLTKVTGVVMRANQFFGGFEYFLQP